MRSERAYGREACWSAWVEWKRLCALGRCSAATGDVLRDFAKRRFDIYLLRMRDRRVCRRTLSLSASEAWHRFEAFLLRKGALRGKCYKEWLFARLQDTRDEPLDVIQGGATLILRDAVREFIREEDALENTWSLSEPFGGDPDMPLTLEDLLSRGCDPAEEASRREYRSLASRHAEEFFRDLPRRERILLLARELGLAVSHPIVEDAAGCRKSIGSKRLNELLRTVFERLLVSYPDDGRHAVVRLAVMTTSALGERALEWGNEETTCSRLFQYSTRERSPYETSQGL